MNVNPIDEQIQQHERKIIELEERIEDLQEQFNANANQLSHSLVGSVLGIGVYTAIGLGALKLGHYDEIQFAS